DVQKDRIEVSIWAWGRGLRSWLVDHIVIDGGPETQASWSELTRILGQAWPHEHGVRLGIAKLAIDTGYEEPAVYAWARRAGFAQVAPVKGVEGFNRAAPVIGPSLSMRRKAGKRSAAVPAFGRLPSRPSNPKPIAISGWPLRRMKKLPRALPPRRASSICRR